MTTSKHYQQQLRTYLEGIDGEVKPFFGGAAAYSDGKIFASLTKVGFALKLPVDDRQALGGKPLQYFPNAPIKKEYVLLPDDVINDQEALHQWVAKSISYVT